MDLSIITSIYNEQDSLRELVGEIHSSIDPTGMSYEILMVDDGSTDDSWETIKDLKGSDPHIRGIRFRRNYGKSAALYEGFKVCCGNLVATLDADLQDDPAELPEMIRMVKEDGYDLVSGWKKKRYDNVFLKNIPSKIYNATARRVTGTHLHDMNCGIKVYRGEVVKHIEIYGEMHRYIPYLAKNAGYTNIGEKVVHHHKRKYGKSKFGMNRFMNGFLDLLSLSFLIKFGKKPMHIFGVYGTFMAFIGAVIAIWLIIAKLVAQAHGRIFRPVTEQPLFYIALLAIILGLQLFLAAFIGEMISRSSYNRNDYNVRETI
ncbi:MAG: glycosyltransferase family 2 protein [Bacteroidales bacterium]|nr:glycosyltransferase family 2 protein [Bacteroidales bacterium]MCI2121880.1 glycosyltransferase family 2 protein [Bacteroidales bacterium]MCI2145652.1 glycosyltransferase family 2 protein [Bacteroidales bacterium]